MCPEEMVSDVWEQEGWGVCNSAVLSQPCFSKGVWTQAAGMLCLTLL